MTDYSDLKQRTRDPVVLDLITCVETLEARVRFLEAMRPKTAKELEYEKRMRGQYGDGR